MPSCGIELINTEDKRTLRAALSLLGTPLGVAFDDPEHLKHAMALRDAVYEHCRMRKLPEGVLGRAPNTSPARTRYLG
jgi:hypothetical protein